MNPERKPHDPDYIFAVLREAAKKGCTRIGDYYPMEYQLADLRFAVRYLWDNVADEAVKAKLFEQLTGENYVSEQNRSGGDKGGVEKRHGEGEGSSETA